MNLFALRLCSPCARLRLPTRPLQTARAVRREVAGGSRARRAWVGPLGPPGVEAASVSEERGGTPLPPVS